MTEASSQFHIDNDHSPPRTWRQWWGDLPGWFRIGSLAVLAMIVLQIATVIRITVGLIEPAEITVLRQRDVGINFESDYRSEPFPGFNRVNDGMRGRTCNDVVFIRLDEKGTDEDLRLLGAQFPNLRRIELKSAKVSAHGLTSLSTCRKLTDIGLKCTDIGDESVVCLTTYERLSSLNLEGTLVTDAAVPILQRIPQLTSLNVAYTDVSLAEIQAWRTSHPRLQILTEKDREPDAMMASIRWADGKRSRRYSGNYKTGINLVGKNSSWTTSSNLDVTNHMGLWWSPAHFQDRGDGDYVLTLQLGDYDADPVTVQIRNGKPSVKSFEFRMQVTEKQAMQKKPLK